MKGLSSKVSWPPFISTAPFPDFAAGLVLEGAAWSGGQLKINDGASVRLAASQVRWVHVDEVSATDNTSSTFINLPVYLGSDRSDLLFTVDLPFEGGVGNFAAMRAVCVTAGA